MDAPPTPCLIGPTGSGKSDVAIDLARATEGEVIACDAFTVYRGLEILTAAPAAPPDVTHHRVGVLDPREHGSAADFVEACDELVQAIRQRGRLPWIVGGTALYLRSWLKGLGAPVPRDGAFRDRVEQLAARYGPGRLHALLRTRDPTRAAEIHPNDFRRVVRALEILRATGRPPSAQRREWTETDRQPAVVTGLRRTPEDLDRRIRRRARAMFEAGVVEEARRLLAHGTSPEVAKVLGLDVLARLLGGAIDATAAEEEIARRTRRFARKQLTFFASFEDVHWVDVAPDDDTAAIAARVLDRVGDQLRGMSE